VGLALESAPDPFGTSDTRTEHGHITEEGADLAHPEVAPPDAAARNHVAILLHGVSENY
jgi:hypothetical protein